jgi:hypothetical protein
MFVFLVLRLLVFPTTVLRNFISNSVISVYSPLSTCPHLCSKLHDMYFNSIFAVSSNVKVTLYKTTVLPLVLYGCETLYFTLRLRVFENKVIRRIFGPKRDEVTG